MNDTQGSMNIQWFPGHIARARRKIAEQIKNVDAVCEVLDARIPSASRNPDVDALTAGKPRLVVLNRADQADGDATRRWAAYFRAQGFAVLETDSKSGAGAGKFSAAVRTLLADKLRAYAEKGQNRVVRVMVLGIPNVGKSTFINRVAGRTAARAEDRPGVTRAQQWVPVDRTLELLDTPGILWPKFEDPAVGERLAFTGAIRDEILDTEELASRLMTLLAARYPQALTARYKLEPQPGQSGFDLLTAAARKRGFLVSGGEANTERMAGVLLDEFRGGKLGRFTLELPEDIPEPNTRRA